MASLKTRFICFLLSLLLFPVSSVAQKVPEEARRHMVRGQTVVEMAKSSAELEAAKNEFQKAIVLAPKWPLPHYELARLQEKTGQLKEAAASLRNYLRLRPKAPDATEIQTKIYQLEYKAEQILSIPEIIDVLTSGFSLSSHWQNVARQPAGSGSATKREGGCRVIWMELVFRGKGNDLVQVLESETYYQPVPSRYQTIKVNGPLLKYFTTVNVCGPTNRGCDSVMQNEVEVVSKSQVNVRQTVIKGGEGAGVADGDTFLCAYQKAAGHK